MSSETLLIVVVAIRVIFLVLFSGSYIWFALLFLRATQLLPPPQRLQLFRGALPRFLAVSWTFVAAMSIGGIGSMVLTTTSIGLGFFLQTQSGLILVLEAFVTLMIIICNALMQFVFLPRAKVEISTAESVDKSLKWLTAKGSKIALDAVSRISWLSFVNLALGIIAIALGVLYSNIL